MNVTDGVIENTEKSWSPACRFVEVWIILVVYFQPYICIYLTHTLIHEHLFTMIQGHLLKLQQPITRILLLAVNFPSTIKICKLHIFMVMSIIIQFVDTICADSLAKV